MIRPALFFGIVATITGCKAPTLKVVDACAAYSGKTCISLEVVSSTPLSVDQLEIAGTSGFALQPVNDVFSPASPGTDVQLPIVVAVLPGDTFGGAFSIAVRGRRASAVVGHGSVDANVSAGEHLTNIVNLDAGLGADADGAMSTVTVDRASGVAANGMDAALITVRLVNGAGAPLAGRAVTLNATPDGTQITPTGLTDAEGKTTASITSAVKGSYTVVATVESNAGPVVLPMTANIKFVTPGVLEFKTQPANALVDELLTVQIAIINPIDHTVVTDATTPVSVTLTNSIGPVSLSGDVTAIPVNGVATFSNLNIDLPAKGVALAAAAPSLGGATSVAFDVTPRPWARITTGLDGASVANGVFDSVDGKRVYVATNSGVYRSLDGGVTWKSASYGIDKTGVYAVAVDPVTPSTIYASDYFDGLYRSTNGGSSWTHLASPGQWVHRIFIDPKHPSTLLVDLGDGTIGRSTDGGMSWTTSLASAYYLASGVDGAYTTVNGNLVKTVDGGANWVTLGPLSAGYIVPSPSEAKTLYAAGATAVMKTIDDGATWVPLTAGLPSTGTSVRVAVSRSDSRWVYVVYNDGSVYVSSNAGQSWSATAFDKSTRGDYLAIASDDPKHMLLMGPNGLFATSDSGATWGRSSTGIAPEISVVAYAYTAYVATRAGVYSLSNDTWYPMAGLPISTVVSGLSTDGVAPEWAATSGGPYRWDANGAKWVKPNATATNVPLGAVSSVAIDPNAASHVLVGGDDGVVSVTTDGGGPAAWTKATVCGGSIKQIQMVTSTIGYAVCRASDPAMSGVHATGDGGITWSNISSVTGGIPATVQPQSFGAAGTGNTIYVAGDNGVVYMRLGGMTTWTASPATTPAGALSSLAVDPAQTRHLFATGVGGVLELTSAGSSWNAISSGLRFGAYPIAIDPAHPTTLYVGSQGGVYRTTTTGK